MILNGFDRSGGSWIARTLAEHPSIRLLYQPFSRTVVHRGQYRIWDRRHRHPAVRQFARSLLRGRIDPTFPRAELWRQHSHGLNRTEATHWVVKETKLHLHGDWWRAAVPEAELWAIQRDPRAVLHSLVRNGFDHAWYGWRAYEQLADSVRRDAALTDYRTLLGWPRSVREATAWVLAVRTHAFLRGVPRTRRLVYEDLVADPDRGFGEFFSGAGLPACSVRAAATVDANVSGLPFERADAFRHAKVAHADLARETELYRALDLLEDTAPPIAKLTLDEGRVP